MLSRATSGMRKKSLIINLAGSKKASQVRFILQLNEKLIYFQELIPLKEGFGIIRPVLKHALDLMHDVKPEIKSDHEKIQSNDPLFNLGQLPHHHHHHHQHHEHTHHSHECKHREFKSKIFIMIFRVVNGKISFFLFRCIIIRNDLFRNF